MSETNEDLEYLQSLSCISEDALFIMHLGNFNDPDQMNCGRPHHKKYSESLTNNTKLPVFIIPGDKDIAECNDEKEAKEY